MWEEKKYSNSNPKFKFRFKFRFKFKNSVASVYTQYSRRILPENYRLWSRILGIKQRRHTPYNPTIRCDAPNIA